jgi:hypothetical protein
MADVFGSNPTFGGAFSVDKAKLTFLPDHGLGQLVQSASASYRRQVSRIFDLGDGSKTYYVAGRAEGNLGIQRMAAPKSVAGAFLQQFGDVCRVASDKRGANTITISAQGAQACPGQGSTTKYTMEYCLITNVDLQISVQSLAMTEGVGLMFAKLDMGS